MPNENQDTGDLLEEILRPTPDQVARWYDGGESPTYKLLREPVNLNELIEYGHKLAIWRDNDTLTYISPPDICDFPREASLHNIIDFPRADRRKYLCLNYYKHGSSLYILGRTDNAIAETVAYFLNLEAPTEKSFSFDIGLSTSSFIDFRAAGSQCLIRMFETAPSRYVHFYGLTLSVEQSIVLATRPHPMQLHIDNCEFEDEGTAFVEELEDRESQFGSLEFTEYTGLDDDNLERLFKSGMIDHLELSIPRFTDEIALKSLSARANSLTYFGIHSSVLEQANFSSLKIVANKLAIDMLNESEDEIFPTDLMLSFWGRVADLGHFVELKVALYGDKSGIDVPSCVVQEVIRATLTNCNLKVLCLSDRDKYLYWDPHVQTIFEGLKDHKALRTLNIDVDFDEAGYLYDREPFGPDFCHLRKLLSHNRYITVKSWAGEIYTDGSSIDELYSLNAFYRGSADLAVEPPPERPSIVATTLVERASHDYQRSALLLSNHVDVLCELVELARLSELSEDDLL